MSDCILVWPQPLEKTPQPAGLAWHLLPRLVSVPRLESLRNRLLRRYAYWNSLRALNRRWR